MGEKLLGVDDVAHMADVSRPTIFRWARSTDNAGKLPPPIHAPGKPQQWPESSIREWLENYNAVRNAEISMEQFAESPELDAVLQRVARTARRLLGSTEIPIKTRRKLAEILDRIQWEHGGKLTADDRRRARKALLQLLAFSGEVSK